MQVKIWGIWLSSQEWIGSNLSNVENENPLDFVGVLFSNKPL